jgi:hypothetical protein
MTTHGFLEDDKKAIDNYKKDHSQYWLTTLGSTEFELIEEGNMEEDLRDIGVEFGLNLE